MSLARSGIWRTIFAIIVVGVAALLGAKFYLERTREISGVLLYQFKGANFFEGTDRENVRQFGLEDAGWFRIPRGHPAFQNLSHESDASGCWKVTAFELRFVGRWRIGPSGHLSAWNSEYDADEIVSMKPIPWPDCDSPYDWERSKD